MVAHNVSHIETGELVYADHFGCMFLEKFLNSYAIRYAKPAVFVTEEDFKDSLRLNPIYIGDYNYESVYVKDILGFVLIPCVPDKES